MTQALIATGYAAIMIALGYALWAMNRVYDIVIAAFDRWCNTPTRVRAQRRRRPPTPRKATR